MPGLETKLWCVQVEYIGVVAVPPLFLIFALHYTAQWRRITPAIFSILVIISLAFLIMVWTNSHHHLFWKTVRLETSPNRPPLLFYDRSNGFWAFVYYSYALLIFGSFLMLRTFIFSPPPDSQAAGRHPDRPRRPLARKRHLYPGA